MVVPHSGSSVVKRESSVVIFGVSENVADNFEVGTKTVVEISASNELTGTKPWVMDTSELVSSGDTVVVFSGLAGAVVDIVDVGVVTEGVSRGCD